MQLGGREEKEKKRAARSSRREAERGGGRYTEIILALSLGPCGHCSFSLIVYVA